MANCPSSLRPFSVSTSRRDADLSDVPPTPISHLTDVEAAMKETVSKFASDVILPKVRDMDEAEVMDPAIVEQLFEQGLMGVEIPEEFGGAGMSFTAAIVGIEELARVDPSVSVLVDVHNTLVNTAVMKWGSKDLQRRFLPKLATNTVGMSNHGRVWDHAHDFQARSASLSPCPAPTPSR
jgi:short-chain 2-methylacyl-CoA dehydrogenase